mmetsp:Transcript_56228/g.167108  ORF Transcript_56228/g.167108 Transcript_56228/m.167108 type:complete len:262 (+) Transcript_56228:400-1185(+)
MRTALQGRRSCVCHRTHLSSMWLSSCRGRRAVATTRRDWMRRCSRRSRARVHSGCRTGRGHGSCTARRQRCCCRSPQLIKARMRPGRSRLLPLSRRAGSTKRSAISICRSGIAWPPAAPWCSMGLRRLLTVLPALLQPQRRSIDVRARCMNWERRMLRSKTCVVLPRFSPNRWRCANFYSGARRHETQPPHVSGSWRRRCWRAPLRSSGRTTKRWPVPQRCRPASLRTRAPTLPAPVMARHTLKTNVQLRTPSSRATWGIW